MGHSNAMELLQAHPLLAHDAVAAMAGHSRLVERARSDATAAGSEEWFLCDSLVRHVRRLCAEGWRAGDGGDARAREALAAWIGDVEPMGEPWSTLCSRTSKLLLDATELVGWVPRQLEDVVPYLNRACDGIALPSRSHVPVWEPTIHRQGATTFPELVGRMCTALDAVHVGPAHPRDLDIFYIRLDCEWHRFFFDAGVLFWPGARRNRFAWTINDLCPVQGEVIELVDLLAPLRFCESPVSDISRDAERLRIEFANGARMEASHRANLDCGARVSLTPATSQT